MTVGIQKPILYPRTLYVSLYLSVSVSLVHSVSTSSVWSRNEFLTEDPYSYSYYLLGSTT